jgi:hypothetical protein
MSTKKLEKHESALKAKVAARENKKNEKDAARLVLFEDYYKNKKMEVRDTATVQEQDKTRRVEMGAK